MHIKQDMMQPDVEIPVSCVVPWEMLLLLLCRCHYHNMSKMLSE